MANNLTFFKTIKHSINRPPVRQGSDRERRWAAYENLILHIHPKKIPLEALRFSRTFGLGGMCVVLFFMLVFSGVLLLFVYQPFPEKAYTSVLTLQNRLVFGQLIRNIHHWSANGLILVTFLHMLRVFFTGAFHTVRQFNWVVGILLFVCVLCSNFTGYLLPWDQLAYWAVTICTGMAVYIPFAGEIIQEVLRGGQDTGANTLLIFFTFHTTLIPAVMVFLMALHFWRVRKAGGIATPFQNSEETGKKPEMVDTIPNLVLREGVVALILIACIMAVSVFVNAPLGDMANPGLSPNPAKAPWYFLGFQELLLHFHPFFSVFLIPVSLFVLITGLPYLTFDSKAPGKWLLSSKGIKTSAAACVAAFVITPSLIVLDEFVIHFDTWLPQLSPIVTGGIIPLTISGLAVAGVYLFIKIRYSPTISETRQAMFVFFIVSFILLTLTGIFFRGKGMVLSFPIA